MSDVFKPRGRRYIGDIIFMMFLVVILVPFAWLYTRTIALKEWVIDR
jgi:hypothetical protein